MYLALQFKETAYVMEYKNNSKPAMQQATELLWNLYQSNVSFASFIEKINNSIQYAIKVDHCRLRTSLNSLSARAKREMRDLGLLSESSEVGISTEPKNLCNEATFYQSMVKDKKLMAILREIWLNLCLCFEETRPHISELEKASEPAVKLIMILKNENVKPTVLLDEMASFPELLAKREQYRELWEMGEKPKDEIESLE